MFLMIGVRRCSLSTFVSPKAGWNGIPWDSPPREGPTGNRFVFTIFSPVGPSPVTITGTERRGPTVLRRRPQERGRVTPRLLRLNSRSPDRTHLSPFRRHKWKRRPWIYSYTVPESPRYRGHFRPFSTSRQIIITPQSTTPTGRYLVRHLRSSGKSPVLLNPAAVPDTLGSPELVGFWCTPSLWVGETQGELGLWNLKSPLLIET